MAISLKKALMNYTRNDTAKADCGSGWFIEIKPFSSAYKALSKEKAKLRSTAVVEKKGSVKLPSAKLDSNAPLFTDEDLDNEFLLGSIDNDIQFFVENVMVSWEGLIDDDGNAVPYSKENALEILTQQGEAGHQLYRELFASSLDSKNFVKTMKEQVEEDAKN